MIYLNAKPVEIGSFPDGTILMKQKVERKDTLISWYYENDREFVALIYLVKHLRTHGVRDIQLYMPYIPNARQDRVRNKEDVFTLKYFTEVLNSLNFRRVTVRDPHSNVSLALINNVTVLDNRRFINKIIPNIPSNDFLMFYPDEGAMKRYSGMINRPYVFGIKCRNWDTGAIEGLDVSGSVEEIKGKDILIVDDICSRGGTFLHSARKLKELGANDIYLYVTHCENTILEGELLDGDLIKKVFTTNSIFAKEHEKIVVL